MLTLSNRLKRTVFIVVVIEIIIFLIIFGLDIVNVIDIASLLVGKYALLIIATFAFALFIVPIILIFIIFFRLDRRAATNYISLATGISNDVKIGLTFGELGMIAYDENYEITWVSDNYVDRGFKIVGESISYFGDHLLREVKKNEETVLERVLISDNQFDFYLLPSMKMLIAKDTTKISNLKKKNDENATVSIRFLIDNYQDVFGSSSEEGYNEYLNALKNLIYSYCKEYNIYLRSLKNDTFLGVMKEIDFSLMREDAFSILDKVKTLPLDEHRLTISIGVGRGTTDMIKLGDLASNAIDIALSRGGDQVVVSNYGNNLEYYGGKIESKHSGNRVKSRVFSRSLISHIKNASNIVVMGHQMADFDAIGSSIAIWFLSLSLGKEAYIVYDEENVETKARNAVKQSINKQDFSNYFLSTSKIQPLITEDTLLILVDVHRPSIVLSKTVLDSVKKIALIDHHRRGEEYIDKPIFDYIDPHSSSASELVTELIRDAQPEVFITKEVATFLLTGILLDTDFFKRSTESRTLEAVVYLKNKSGDLKIATNNLKDEYEEVVLINKILASSEVPYFGIMLSTAPDEYILDRVVLSKVADTAEEIKGVDAAFVIGRITADSIGISARSGGTFNVQIVLEKLGGGGHFGSAGAQIKGSSIEEIKKELIKLIGEAREVSGRS